jgi:hypothetical protein
MMFAFRRVADDRALPTEPGTYRRITEAWKAYHLKTPTQRFWAECVCPLCGKVSMVGRNHMVADDGVVSPSYVCPFPPCAFHEFVRLNDWNRVVSTHGT